MRTLEIITAEYNAAVAALKAKQEEFDKPVEGEEPNLPRGKPAPTP